MKHFARILGFGLMVCLIGLLWISPAKAAGSWYVAPGGSDANSCSAPEAACATVSGALAKAAAGDTIYVAAGDYPMEEITLSKNVTLLGGWNMDFSGQTGLSAFTLPGSGVRHLVVDLGVTAAADHFVWGNRNSASNGGSIQNNGTLTITHSKINDNVNDETGISAAGLRNNGVLLLEDSQVSDNRAPTGMGGGIYTTPGSTLTIRRTIISGNQATSAAGLGIESAAVTIEDSAFYYNGNANTFNGEGGAIFVTGSSLLSISNTTLSSNNGLWRGGGIFIDPSCVAPGCQVDLRNVTISDNTASEGGGIWVRNADVLFVKNTLVGGLRQSLGNCYGGGTIHSGGFNLLETSRYCTYETRTSDLLDVDPKIGQLLAIPGKMGYSPLFASSPAIDAGDPIGCTRLDNSAIIFDVRGVLRDSRCDIGAYEYAVSGIITQMFAISVDDQETITNAVFSEQLEILALDGQGSLAYGQSVTFSAPASGASLIFANSNDHTETQEVPENGVVIASLMTANDQGGGYAVVVTPQGQTEPSLSFNMQNFAGWYVRADGSDTDNCTSPATACETIQAALDKALTGGTIYVTAETYSPDDGLYLAWVKKEITLSGGWNATFTEQVGMTIADGLGQGRLFEIDEPTAIDRFWIRNGKNRLGGGIYCPYGGYLTVTNSAVTGNEAKRDDYGAENAVGGGMYLGCSARLENVTVAGNRAMDGGGGVFGGGEFYNVTIAENHTDASGGGVSSTYGSEFYLQNSLLVGNTADSSGQNCAGRLTSNGYILAGDLTGCSFTGGTGDQTSVTDAGVIPTYSLFGIESLSATSPAVNTGDPNGCKDHLGNPITTDQRGVARDTTCDIGAFEWVQPGLAEHILMASGAGQRAELGGVFSQPLLAAVVDEQGNPVPGVTVEFLAPSNGASAIFDGSGALAIQAVTGADGLASSGTLHANTTGGLYEVLAQMEGISQPAIFNLANVRWYVAPGGSDQNGCYDKSVPCASVEGIMAKSLFQTGDAIYVAAGTYPQQINVTRAVRILGGWNASFTAQTGMSVIDGQNNHAPLWIHAQNVYHKGMPVSLERLEITRSSVEGVWLLYADVTIDHCNIHGNRLVGIKADYGTRLLVKDSLVQDNGLLEQGGVYGGGIYIAADGNGHDGPPASGEIWNSSIISNRAYSGGGMYAGGDLLVVNTTISGNQAASNWDSGMGGGIFKGGGSLRIYSSTITGNRANGEGGGIAVGGNPTPGVSAELWNTIISGNTMHDGDSDCSGKIISHGFSMVGFLGSCDYNPGAGDVVEPWEPRIVPLAALGGIQQGHRLYVGSPAIDGGNPGGCRGPDGQLLTGDQRGLNRTTDGNGDGIVRCDIGALEIASAGQPLNVGIWYVSRQGKDVNTCRSPGSPCRTLNAVIAKAQPGDTVRITAEVYQGTGTEVVSVTKNLNFSGGWDQLFGSRIGYTVLDGEEDRIVMRVVGDTSVSLERFQVINGRSDTHLTAAGIEAKGYTRLLLRNVLVSKNKYTGDYNFEAGAILCNGPLWLHDSTVTRNIGHEGGGLRGRYINLHNTIVSENQAIWNNGGGIFGSVIRLYGSIFSKNYAHSDGGAVYASSLLISEDTRYIQNQAHNGGAISIFTADADIRSSSFIQNQAVTGNGGAIYAFNDLYITQSAFVGNIAAGNGGGAVGKGVIVNSTFHSNLAGGSGGAAGALPGGGHFTLYNTTIVYNFAEVSGGGVYTHESFVSSIRNSILFGNGASSGAQCAGRLDSGGYNLLGNMAGCSFTSASGDRVTNPMLRQVTDPLAPFIMLLPGSPAIDGGNPAGCTDGTDTLHIDQTGAYRPMDGNNDRVAVCDVGAIEGSGIAGDYLLFLPLAVK